MFNPIEFCWKFISWLTIKMWKIEIAFQIDEKQTWKGNQRFFLDVKGKKKKTEWKKTVASFLKQKGKRQTKIFIVSRSSEEGKWNFGLPKWEKLCTRNVIFQWNDAIWNYFISHLSKTKFVIYVVPKSCFSCCSEGEWLFLHEVIKSSKYNNTEFSVSIGIGIEMLLVPEKCLSRL